MNDRPLLSRQEAARTLGLSPDTVDRLIKSGELNAVRIGRSVKIPHGDVLAIVARGATTHSEPQQ